VAAGSSKSRVVAVDPAVAGGEDAGYGVTQRNRRVIAGCRVNVTGVRLVTDA